MLRKGVNFLISNISYTKQLNLVLHLLQVEICLTVKIFQDNTVFLSLVFAIMEDDFMHKFPPYSWQFQSNF